MEPAVRNEHWEDEPFSVGPPKITSVQEHVLVEGPVSFVDTRNNTRSGKAYLRIPEQVGQAFRHHVGR